MPLFGLLLVNYESDNYFMSAVCVNKAYRWSTSKCHSRICGRDHECVGPIKLRVPIVSGSSASHGLGRDLQLLVESAPGDFYYYHRLYWLCAKEWLLLLFLPFVILMFILYSLGAQQGCKSIMCGSSVPETNSSRGKKSQLLVWQCFGKVGSYHASLVLEKK